MVLDLETAKDRSSRQNTSIRAICLDFGNVLVRFDYGRLWQSLSGYSSFSESEMAEHFNESNLLLKYESGRMSSQCFYRETCSLCEIELPYEDFCRAWSSVFDHDSTVDLSFLSFLARNYTLVLLSNTNEIHFAFMRGQYPILRAFHHFALSFQIGVMKPGKDIYLAALNLAHVNACEAFYADDMKGYVDTALALGFRAACVSTKDGLIEAMLLNGITPPL